MNAETFWKNVTQLMKSKKISQETLCKDLGMSIYTFRSSISKQVLPRVDVAKTLADYLGTTIDFLLTGNKEGDYKLLYTDVMEKLRSIVDGE